MCGTAAASALACGAPRFANQVAAAGACMCMHADGLRAYVSMSAVNTQN